MTVKRKTSPKKPLRPEQPWFVMSAAQQYSLIPSDNPVISHFYRFTVDHDASMTYAVPDGCIDILFDCDPDNPAARVCGTTLEARAADMNCDHPYFGVRFAPGVIPDFLDISAEELTNHEINLFDVVPKGRLAFERIVQAQDLSQQMAIFNQYFTPGITRQPSTLTAQALGMICQQNGNLRIEELEALTGYTCRTIQRQFRQDTGLSPKAFCRAIRCQSALNSIHHADGLSFSDMALDLGFSDQSHFLREFKKLVNTTPLDYQRRIGGNIWGERLRFH